MTGSITADVIPYITSSDPLLLSGLAVASIFRYLVSTVRDTVSRLTNRASSFPFSPRTPRQRPH